MSDKIILTGIEVFGWHGCGEIERRRGQIFKVDVELNLDLSKAGRTDEITKTVDYAAVVFEVERIVSGAPHKLIESLAEEIAATLLNKYALIDSLKVTVHKPDAPLPVKYLDAAVSIVRWRE